MSDTRPLAPRAEPTTGPPPYESRDEFTLRIPKLGGGGPGRAAFKTTEFWLTVGLVVLLMLATAVDPEGLPAVDAWRFATYAIVGYALSRGLAKLGNRSDATHERWSHDQPGGSARPGPEVDVR